MCRGRQLFWKVLDHLHGWQRENLPGCETPQGNEILIWLLKCKTAQRPLKDLYRSSRISEPTLRAGLRTFIDAGLVELEVNGNDLRNRFARVTPKFESTIAAYRQRFGEIALLIQTLNESDSLGDIVPPRSSGKSIDQAEA